MKPLEFIQNALLAVCIGLVLGCLLADWSAEESTFQQPRSE